MIVIDNAIGPNLQDEVDELVKGFRINWLYNSSTSYAEGTSIHDYAFFHVLYTDGKPVSELFQPFFMIFLSCLDSAGQRLNELYRLRINMTLAAHERTIHEPHVDSSVPHQTGIFYLEDSDGPTTIYNEKYDPNSKLAIKDHMLKTNLTVMNNVDPVKYRFISYNGLHYHNGCTPLQHKRRILLNCNYSVK